MLFGVRNVHVHVVTEQGGAPGLLLGIVGQPVRDSTDLVLGGITWAAGTFRAVCYDLIPNLCGVRPHGTEPVLSDLHRRPHWGATGTYVADPAICRSHVLHDKFIKPRCLIYKELAKVAGLNDPCGAAHNKNLLITKLKVSEDKSSALLEAQAAGLRCFY